MRIANRAAACLTTAMLILVMLPATEATQYRPEPDCEYDASWYKPFAKAACSASEICEPGQVLWIDVYSFDDSSNGAAEVEGDWSCGGEHVGCRGEKQCTSASGTPTTVAGTGSCSGQAHESWASDLQVSCWSEISPPPPPPTQYCPLVIEPSPPYPSVCINRPAGLKTPQCNSIPRIGAIQVTSDCGILVNLDQLPRNMATYHNVIRLGDEAISVTCTTSCVANMATLEFLDDGVRLTL